MNANVDNKLAASLHIDYPMLFELRNNAAERFSHCGVLEFIAEDLYALLGRLPEVLFAIFLELVLQFATSKFKVSEMSSRNLMCLFFFSLFLYR